VAGYDSKPPFNSHLESNRSGMELELVSTPPSTFKYLIRNLRQYLDGQGMEDVWWEVYRWYCDQPDWQESRQVMLQALFHRNQVGNIGPEYSKRLYPSPFKASVSRLYPGYLLFSLYRHYPKLSGPLQLFKIQI
jgi:ATP-dependent helicase/DNAse subunit B